MPEGNGETDKGQLFLINYAREFRGRSFRNAVRVVFCAGRGAGI